MPRAAQFFVAALLFAALFIQSARADWTNLTGAESAPNIAEITVLDDRVRVALEVYVGDIARFEALVPDAWLKEKSVTRPALALRLRQFAEKTFRIVTDDGSTLPVELKLAEPRLRKDRYAPFAGMTDPLTRQRIPGAPEDKRVLYAELEYPFAGKPKHLTIIPPLDAQGKPTVTTGFIAYHKAVPIIDFRYLTQPERLTLDWQDPWYTEFDNRTLKRHHKSALMSFLYVEPREIRHEVLVRVRDLQEWTDLGLSNATLIDGADQERIKERAAAFFATHNPLSIDGTLVQPASIRAEFLNVSLTGVKIVEDPRPLDSAAAMLGLMLSYPIKHLPQKVAVKWELFNERITQLPATSIDPAGPYPTSIEVDDPNFEWHNNLLTYKDPQVLPVVLDDGRSFAMPVLSLVLLALALGAAMLAFRTRRASGGIICAVSLVAALLSLRIAVVHIPNPLAGPPEADVAAEILSSVLANVNYAYVERDPAALQQALQPVVATGALDKVQHELDRALAIKVVGGGVARVDSVDKVTLKELALLEGRPGFRGVAEWTAKASGSHWGHAHNRTIRFRALVELSNEQGAWKLADITVIDARQEL